MSKNIFWTYFVLISTVMLFAVESKAQRSDQAYLVRSFDVSNPELLDIQTSGGFIRVLGSERDDVSVEMYVRRGGQYLDDTDITLDHYDIEIEQVGNRIKVHANRESGSGWRFWRNENYASISFIIHTPRITNVDAGTSGGSVTAENLEGRVQLRTSGGSMTLKELTGLVEARTSGGSISVEHSEGEIHARTSGGGITVSNSQGILEFRTSGGSIQLNDVDGTVTARTSGGSINAKSNHVGDHLDLRTSGGSITVTVPGGTGYELDLSGTRVQAELQNFSGEVERNRVSGTIGNGGPVIRARTSGGTVRVNYF
jgi:hypothetical protein